MFRFLFVLFFLYPLTGWAASENLPNVTAHSWLVADEKGQIIEGFNTENVRSIASITKLITVMTVLDSKQSLDEVIPTKLYNKNITRQTLIDLTLVKSDNTAATILCQQYPGGYDECIRMMNRKLQELGMYDTRVHDSTGLNENNVSTATDLLKLVQAASTYQPIREASSKDRVSLLDRRNKRTEVRNTNYLVGKGYDFIVSKTGFISKSGGCIVFMLNTINGVRTVVLLGSRNTKTRIPEAAFISTRFQ
jgi:serine-type D-Ala-D-Ala endopeptidase (penicillin-binding protein 7)